MVERKDRSRAEELRIHPDVVVTSGELLTDDIRRKLEGRFGCYVQTHYSCTEGGEIACGANSNLWRLQ